MQSMRLCENGTGGDAPYSDFQFDLTTIEMKKGEWNEVSATTRCNLRQETELYGRNLANA